MVEFEKYLVEVQDFRKPTDPYRGIYKIYLQFLFFLNTLESLQHVTGRRLDLQTLLGFWPIMPKNLSDTACIPEMPMGGWSSVRCPQLMHRREYGSCFECIIITPAQEVSFVFSPSFSLDSFCFYPFDSPSWTLHGYIPEARCSIWATCDASALSRRRAHALAPCRKLCPSLWIADSPSACGSPWSSPVTPRIAETMQRHHPQEGARAASRHPQEIEPNTPASSTSPSTGGEESKERKRAINHPYSLIYLPTTYPNIFQNRCVPNLCLWCSFVRNQVKSTLIISSYSSLS